MSRTPKSGAVSWEYHLAVVERWEERARKLEAEVATLRGHVKLLAEWQAAKRAELATPAPPDGDCSAWIKSLQGTSSVEDRMLAADLGEEVGRG